VLLPLTVAAIVASALFPAGRREWALSLGEQPTRYTALSFNTSWALPDIDAFGAPIPISFEISNQEGRPTRYQYVLSETDGIVTRRLGAAARLVASGGKWTVSTIVRPTCPGPVCHIEVHLPGHPETIEFVVNLYAAPPRS
jgi:hypothetical protein